MPGESIPALFFSKFDCVCDFLECAFAHLAYSTFARVVIVSNFYYAFLVDFSLNYVQFLIFWEVEAMQIIERTFRRHLQQIGADDFVSEVQWLSALPAAACGSRLFGSLCARLVHLHLFSHYLPCVTTSDPVDCTCAVDSVS